ncbi:MAG: hypothetical protein ABR508_08900 [Candidatus Baltobacteraceae bacterium]
MKIFRVSASVLTFTALSLLAACGGGGGGGGGFTPGGGGPTATPTPGGGPTATPTPASTPGSVGTSSQVLKAEENFTNPDMASWYTSGSASWSAHAGDTTSGNNGDGDTCDTTMTSDATGTYFHSHSFVGIYFNGTEMGLPSAIGIENSVEPTKGTPAHPSDNYEVENGSCMFHVHTHDFSGLVHVEVPQQSFDPSYNNLPSYANLQTLLDVWGAQLTSSGLVAGSNSLTGATTIYTGLSSTKDASGNDLVNSYTPVIGSAASVALRHHEAIWIVIGTPPVAGLPQVTFVITN